MSVPTQTTPIQSTAIQSTTLDSQVTEAIDAAPHLMGRTLRIETHEGHVRLHGTVGSYFQKQMAQETVRRVDGVLQIENELEVCW